MVDLISIIKLLQRRKGSAKNSKELDVPKVKPLVLDHLHVLSFENLRKLYLCLKPTWNKPEISSRTKTLIIFPGLFKSHKVKVKYFKDYETKIVALITTWNGKKFIQITDLTFKIL
ncbi:hypothetical protein BpHYR1_034615 [Brachionus plicatilis]|uniref:Uncharacterized protein n=1 Tax=Brachionus plicatilis TaxID=10195 RepID=A0A3M7SZY2_BRAPC|nr:hypothetical protein BpHYR1_034615 [Brachionus plicatilis]